MKKLALDLVGVLEVLDDRVAGYRQEVLSELIKQIMPELESRGFTVEDLLYSIIDYIAADPLTHFVSELIPLLRQEGFTFEDLLNALTNWTVKQPGLTEAVKHLEEAASIVYDVYKHTK